MPMPFPGPVIRAWQSRPLDASFIRFSTLMLSADEVKERAEPSYLPAFGG